MSSSFYESSAALWQLAVDHYLLPEHASPMHPEARAYCGSLLAVREIMRELEVPAGGRALDLGCAVGRNTFELRRHFQEVTGIDRSPTLIATAQALQQNRTYEISHTEKDRPPKTCTAVLPEHLKVDGVSFLQGDACDLPGDLGQFDLVFMDKLLDRLADPRQCLRQMPGLVKTSGWLALISPYWWHAEYVSNEKGLGTPARALAQMCEMLQPDFRLQRKFNVPVFLHDRPTWFVWGVAEGTLWRRA